MCRELSAADGEVLFVVGTSASKLRAAAYDVAR